MAKPLFHDIVPPEKKSIKKIPIPERGRASHEPAPRATEKVERPSERPAPAPRQRAVRSEPVDEPTPEPTPRVRTRKVKKSKVPTILTILALLVIVGLAFTFVPKSSGATISVTPKGQVVSVNATFNASKDPNGTLPYQVAVYEKDGKLTVPATGDEYAETKATGVIRIFNDYSSAPQKLVANTRFQTPNGLIFRISQEVTIPGKTASNPGSVDVAVTADKVGADYNVGLSDFTIPGFKGDAKYDKIYARSKSSIDGGFAGNRKKVDGSQLTAARQKIRDELEASLVRQMKEFLPENFIFPGGAYFIEYQSLPDTEVSGGVQLTERATFHGIMFTRKDLAQAITEKVNGQANTEGDLFGVDNLGFTAKTGTSSAPWSANILSFSLNGTTTLVASIDTDKLKNDLIGKPRNSLSAILTNYPGIAKAQVVMRPFWKQSFPTNPSEITIDLAKEPLPQ